MHTHSTDIAPRADDGLSCWQLKPNGVPDPFDALRDEVLLNGNCARHRRSCGMLALKTASAESTTRDRPSDQEDPRTRSESAYGGLFGIEPGPPSPERSGSPRAPLSATGPNYDEHHGGPVGTLIDYDRSPLEGNQASRRWLRVANDRLLRHRDERCHRQGQAGTGLGGGVPPGPTSARRAATALPMP